MLKLKYLFENYDLAKEALNNWSYDRDTLDGTLTNFRISSNAIYPFYQDGTLCFLRLAPVGEKSEKNVFGELEFIESLLQNGFPALVPVPSLTGELCLKIDTEWGEYFAAVFKGVNGAPLEDTELTSAVLYQYGKTLGKLHALSSEFTPKRKKWDYLEVLSWIGQVLRDYHAPAPVISTSDEIRNELNRLPKCGELYGLIHYDFELDNVFFDPEKGTCSVIDFDDGMYHWYALDVEQALDSLTERLSGEPLKEAEAEFIRGYRTEHCYTEEMEASRPLMRRFIDLYGYARLIRCVAGKFSDEPEWLTELRKKLDYAIAEKEKSLS